MKPLLILSLLCAALLGEEVKEGHSHQGHAFNEGPRQAGPLMENTGEVHFPITTAWDSGQDYFDQGVGQLHGFWYYEAERSFRQILAKDPDCLMAYWGLAMANVENDKRAREFLEKARKLIEKSKITEREKSYLKALTRFHDSKKEKDKNKRAKKYLRDMEEIILAHPNDIEAKAFYVCASWQLNHKGAPISSHIGLDAILEQIFAKSPNHPAHHYAIHLWDYRKHEQALDSAAKLGSTAPAIAHMWHMPGHIYSKSKRYHDAMWHQQASACIDHAHMQRNFLLPDQIHNYAHNNQWIVESCRYLGDKDTAIAMAKSLLANPRHPKLNSPDKHGSAYYGRRALITALEEFELWQDALDLSQTRWLAEDLKSADNEHLRLRLLGLANYHLEKKEALLDVVIKLDAMLMRSFSAQNSEGEKARAKAKKDKKNDKEIEKLVKAARKKKQSPIDRNQSSLKFLRGHLAQLNGDLKTAREAAKSIKSSSERALRLLSLGDKTNAAKKAHETLKKDSHLTIPTARSIYVLSECGELKKEHFEKLRKISASIDLTAPPFARLAPIAKKLDYPADWRIPHVPADDLLPRPQLTDLGPLHWTPPTAPSFSLPDQHGKQTSLSDYRGKPLVLVFYLGAGCLHCTEQLTAMADDYQKFRDANLPILAISTDTVTDLKKSQDNYTKGDIPFPLVSDHARETFRSYTAHDDFENQALHGTFIIDGKDRILWSDISADPFIKIDFLIQEATRLLDLHQKGAAISE